MFDLRGLALVLALMALLGCGDRFMIMHTSPLARVRDAKQPERLAVVAQSPSTGEFRAVRGESLDLDSVRHPDVLGSNDTGYRQVRLKQRRGLVIGGWTLMFAGPAVAVSGGVVFAGADSGFGGFGQELIGLVIIVAGSAAHLAGAILMPIGYAVPPSTADLESALEWEERQLLQDPNRPVVIHGRPVWPAYAP